MAETASWEQFRSFDWSDEGWNKYLENIYPPPNQKQLLKFKKKWYKRHVDPAFDDSYEPPVEPAAAQEPAHAAPASSSSSAAAPGANARATSSSSSASAPGDNSFSHLVFEDGSRWRKMGSKATICAAAHALAITFGVAAAAGAFPPYQALVVFSASFILELFAKYGLKFNSSYVHTVLLDDVGVMPMMAFTLLTPGMGYTLRVAALVPPFLTALMSFCQIAKGHPRMPGFIREFFLPLSAAHARFQVMQARAWAEVLLGLVLIVALLNMRAAILPVLLFWNFMMMRYLMNPWTQATFRNIDGILRPIVSSLPLVGGAYDNLKSLLNGFVDPSSRRFGKMCTIL